MPRTALRTSHIGITLNDRSGEMEGRVSKALATVRQDITDRFALEVQDVTRMPLVTITTHLNSTFHLPDGIHFTTATGRSNTFIQPDGGFLFIEDASGSRRDILVTEAKRQGTNSQRALEGKSRQAQGNAVERLRKNMQGVDSLFAGEAITPFVCFGEGDDFAEGSSILDRVSTMNGFFPLNTVFVDKIYLQDPTPEVFKPASLFFRETPWSPEEMRDIMWAVCQRSITYYDERYSLR